MNKNKSKLSQKLEQENCVTGKPRREFQEIQMANLKNSKQK